MPLIIEGGRVPTRWAESVKARQANGRKNRTSVDHSGNNSSCLSLALINNMPDPALEDTEMQFFGLLDAASGDVPVMVRLYSLHGLPRGERGQQHLSDFYFDFNDLWQNRFDGVIITGTEPREPKLQDESYWGLLTQVFDWAQENTASAVLSCLAAHASAYHADGVARHRLPDKQFGVFESQRTCEHALLDNGVKTVRFPHSRWNEVRANELAAAGYSVLTQSAGAGVDLFVKKKKKSLFVHFQGHPEYGAQTLLKEYRRDIKRFLRQERETYPTMPAGYFDAGATALLTTFRDVAESDRREEMIESFPEAAFAGTLQSTWSSSAMSIYGNWLRYMVAKKGDVPKISPSAALPHDVRENTARARLASPSPTVV